MIIQKGFSLIEVLLALAILSLGLLGLGRAELQAFHETKVNTQYNTLMLQLISLQEQLQVSSCSQKILARWESEAKSTIPSLVIETHRVSDHSIIFHLQWQNNNEKNQLHQILAMPARL